MSTIIRKAYYLGGEPPIDWFLTAALVYDKVKINTGAFQFPHTYGTYPLLHAVVPEAGVRHEYYHKICTDPQVDFLEGADLMAPFDLSQGGVSFDGTDLLTVLMEVNDQVDFHVGDDYYLGRQIQPTILTAFNALVPNPERITSVSISQIVDFRQKNEYRRTKFQKAAESLIQQWDQASTEEELNKLIRTINDALREQYGMVEANYRDTRIDATVKSIGSLGTPPAIIAAVTSALHLAAWEIGSGLATVGLSAVGYLLAKEKAARTVNESPWAYIWHLKKEL